MNQPNNQANAAFVIHHAADPDGRFSGAVAGKWAEENGFRAIFHGYDHHHDPRVVMRRISDHVSRAKLEAAASSSSPSSSTSTAPIVIITDIALPEKYMAQLQVMVKRRELADVIWIDHHLTAMAELETYNFNGLRRTGTAACELAWEFFYGGGAVADGLEREAKAVPVPVKLAAQYDVYNQDGEMAWETEVLPFKFYLDSCDLDITNRKVYERVRDTMLHPHVAPVCDMIKSGNKIMDYIRARVRRMPFFNVRLAGIDFRACGAYGPGGSFVFDMAEQRGQAFMNVFSVDGMFARVSLYHGDDKELNLSLVAKRFGGGGHAGACGFTVPHHVLSDILRGNKYAELEDIMTSARAQH